MFDAPTTPPEHPDEIHRWPAADRPFVRIDTPDGEVLRGSAQMWRDLWIGFMMRTSPGHFDLETFWVPREWVTREPGWLPEYKPYWCTSASYETMWEPSTCPWPRTEPGNAEAPRHAESG
ncbi:hypothetical protein [Zhihengliuella sp.]|uniref:hypothetical protein n=1 Tax=Zhihengliuella sp. TaxID=1954483 RepID=UPI002810FCC3|nr:hypothetical protein [Zhihengliuella sp.]